jgi:beta-lactam-binding protein with PASTA domain
VKRKKASKAKRGKVLSQSPKPGKKLALNAKVKLVVGR